MKKIISKKIISLLLTLTMLFAAAAPALAAPSLDALKALVPSGAKEFTGNGFSTNNHSYIDNIWFDEDESDVYILVRSDKNKYADVAQISRMEGGVLVDIETVNLLDYFENTNNVYTLFKFENINIKGTEFVSVRVDEKWNSGHSIAPEQFPKFFDFYTVVFAPGGQGTWDADDETYGFFKAGDQTPHFSKDLAVAHNPGYTFDGWSDGVYKYNTTADLPPTVTGDATYTALWSANAYTVTYAPGLHGDWDAASAPYTTAGHHYGDDTPALDVQDIRPQAGWNFNGWSPQPAAKVTGDAVYTALWEQKTYIVEYAPGEHGHWAIGDEGTSFSAHYGDATPFFKEELKEECDEGWAFIGWSPHLDEFVGDYANGKITYVAQWKPQYVVAYDPGFHGTWDVNDESTGGLSYDDTTPDFSVDPYVEHDDGYVFAGWDPEIAEKVTGNATYVAQWKKIHDVVFMDEDDVYDAQKVVHGDGAERPEDPEKDGFTFGGWDTPFNEVTQDLTIYAIWYYNDYIVNYYLDHTPIKLAASKTVNIASTERDSKTEYPKGAADGIDKRFYADEQQIDVFLPIRKGDGNEFDFHYYFEPRKGDDTPEPEDPDDPTDPYYEFFIKIVAGSATRAYNGSPLTQSKYEAVNIPLLYENVLEVDAKTKGAQLEVGSSPNIIVKWENDVRQVFFYIGDIDVTELFVYGAVYVNGILTVTPAGSGPTSGPGRGGFGPFAPPSPSPRPTPTPTPTPQRVIDDSVGPLAGQFTADHIQYINGYPDGNVRPDANITRAEVSAIIFRLLADPAKHDAYASVFGDVAQDAWYAQSVRYLTNIKIVNGYPGGIFKPDNPITRAEFATLISGFDNLEPSEGDNFSDTRGHWAEEYINSAAEKGWVSGYPDGSFLPEQYMTRAEVVSVVNRMLNRSLKAWDVPDWAPNYFDLPPDHWGYADMTEASLGHTFSRKPDGLNENWIGELTFIAVLES